MLNADAEFVQLEKENAYAPRGIDFEFHSCSEAQ